MKAIFISVALLLSQVTTAIEINSIEDCSVYKLWEGDRNIQTEISEFLYCYAAVELELVPFWDTKRPISSEAKFADFILTQKPDWVELIKQEVKANPAISIANIEEKLFGFNIPAEIANMSASDWNKFEPQNWQNLIYSHCTRMHRDSSYEITCMLPFTDMLSQVNWGDSKAFAQLALNYKYPEKSAEQLAFEYRYSIFQKLQKRLAHIDQDRYFGKPSSSAWPIEQGKNFHFSNGKESSVIEVLDKLEIAGKPVFLIYMEPMGGEAVAMITELGIWLYWLEGEEPSSIALDNLELTYPFSPIGHFQMWNDGFDSYNFQAKGFNCGGNHCVEYTSSPSEFDEQYVDVFQLGLGFISVAYTSENDEIISLTLQK